MRADPTPASLVRPWLDDVAAAARMLVERGWAEANAGNLSFRAAGSSFRRGTRIELPVSVPSLTGQSLIIKRAGVRMRDLADAPAPGLCAVFIIGPRAAQVVSGPPSSELAAHLAAHARLAVARAADRVLLHTHPTDLAALSLLVDHRRLPGLLARVHTEAPVLLEGRLTALRFALPGSVELAGATASALARYQAVVWPAHGIAASGPDFASALDLVELADKCARIALLSDARPANRIGLSPSQRRAIRRKFGLRP